MGAGGGGVFRIADDTLDALQRPPAHGKGGIEVDREQQRLRRVRRILELDEAEATFFVQATVAGLNRRQAIQQREGLGRLAKSSTGVRGDQQEIAVLRVPDKQGFRALGGLRDLIGLGQTPEAADFGFDGKFRSVHGPRVAGAFAAKVETVWR